MKSINLSHILTLFLFCTSCLVQGQGIFSSLEFGLDNPDVTSIRIYPEEERIGEFISRISEFDQLKEIQIKRYTGSASSKLLLATLSNIDALQSLQLELIDVEMVPPYLDQFEELKTLTFSFNSDAEFRLTQQQFILLNGVNSMIVKVLSDQQMALDYMDRLIAVYPSMAPNLENFRSYVPNPKLERVPKSYASFTSILLPKSNSVLIDPAIESRFVTNDGSVITIPALAFVDDNNTVVTDSVQIDFTYFRDQLDIAFAQISMEVTDAATASLLESAGMFELNASVDGEFLSLGNGNEIDILFNSTAAGDYNIYRFDDGANNWDITENDNRPIDAAQSIYTPAYFRYSDLIAKINLPNSQKAISYNQSEIFASNEFIRYEERAQTTWVDYDIEDDETHADLSRHYRMAAKKKKSELPFIELSRERSPDRNLRTHFFFKLDEQNHVIPEIRTIRRLLWRTVDQVSSSDFRNTYVRNNSYVDFRLNYTPETEEFQFIFKEITGEFDTLIAVPFLGKRNATGSHVAEHLDILTSYQKAFGNVSHKKIKAKESGETKYARQLQAHLAKRTEQEHRAWEKAKARMLPAEKKKSFEEWHSYYNNLYRMQQQQLLAQNGNSFAVVRAISLGEMGMWNCDNPVLRLERIQPINIMAKNSDDRNFSVAVLFLDFNSSYTTGSKSKIDREGACAYLLFDGQENVSWITPHEVKNRKTRGLEAKQDFVPIASIDVEGLRRELFSSL